MEPSFLYPPNPLDVTSQDIHLSATFKKQVMSVMGSIILFFIVYFLLVLFSIALAAACIYGGIMLIVNFPKFITILIGIGVMGLGIMVFVFLIKFIFAVNRYDRSGLIEIKESSQPYLFAFIRQLIKDTSTRFPKRIYLSPDVNASVFYDSSFWSMFFPIRKNLQIGLGLVNSINISEFKAVMAHEFGHFSQSSMKLGSFVYNVNHIIHNMLFDNRGYAASLQSFANTSGYFAFFTSITVEIVKAIQWILRGMYGFINKSYMALSRQMEFHADAISASVSGGNNLISALRKIEIANTSYQIVIDKCNSFLAEKYISENIFSNHSTVLKKIAQDFNLNMENALPFINEDVAGKNFTRINFKDQWASHPSTDEREKCLNALNITIESLNISAWVLFKDTVSLQKEMTRKVYETAQTPESKIMNNDFFESRYKTEIDHFTLPEAYKDFYNGRMISVPDMGELEKLATDLNHETFDSIYTEEITQLPAKLAALANDVEILKAINEKRIDTKTFDFDGEKYKSERATEIMALLQSEQERLKEQLELTDKKALAFFYFGFLNDTGLEIKSKYDKYFSLRKKTDDYISFLNKMMEKLSPIYAGETLEIEDIEMMITKLKEDEKQFKNYLLEWKDQEIFDRKPVLKERIEKFIECDYVYFTGRNFMDNELFELNALVHESWNEIYHYQFEKFREILITQLEVKERKITQVN